jgi:hypothetical protein
MFESEERGLRAELTLNALHTAVEELARQAREGEAVGALSAYASVRVLVDDLREMCARDSEAAGRPTTPTANVNENVERLLSSARALARLEPDWMNSEQHAAWASGAVMALNGLLLR